MQRKYAIIYFKECMEKLEPYMKHAINYSLIQWGAVMELGAGEGLLSQRFFHDKFKRIELLDLCDHSSTIKDKMPLTDVTRKVKFT